jgi:hypothetical protein
MLLALAVGGALLVGCGGDDSSEAAGGTTAGGAPPAETQAGEGQPEPTQEPSGSAEAGERRAVLAAVRKFMDRDTVCETVTDRLLEDSYEVAGLPGRKRCEAVASKSPDARLTSAEILTLTGKKAVVRVSESRGETVEATLVLANGKWLVDVVKQP